MEAGAWCGAALLALAALVLAARALLRLGVRACTCTRDMRGHVVLVTGANAGIGYEIALGLARRGARVLLACRDAARAQAARERIARDTGNPAVECVALDLASLAAVRACAADVLARAPRLHVLVNNAGVYACGNALTADGIVLEMQVNHFAPFLLTLLLLPALARAGGRVVSLASVLHHLGVADPKRMNVPGAYGDLRTYCNSKLCNVTVTAELARRGAALGVAVTCLHPGIVRTGVAARRARWRLAFAAWCWLCERSACEAAATALHLALSEEGRTLSGGYFVECRWRRARPGAQAPAAGAALWRYSEQLVGYTFEEALAAAGAAGTLTDAAAGARTDAAAGALTDAAAGALTDLAAGAHIDVAAVARTDAAAVACTDAEAGALTDAAAVACTDAEAGALTDAAVGALTDAAAVACTDAEAGALTDAAAGALTDAAAGALTDDTDTTTLDIHL